MCPTEAHPRRSVETANAEVSWSRPTDTQPVLAATSYTPYGIALPTVDRGSHAPAPAPGCPGPPLPPVVLVVPDEVSFLGVHADHRPAGLLVGAGQRVGIAEPGVAVGMELPSRTFALAYKLYPAERSNCPTVHELTGCPCAVSSAASVRVDLDVHRNADIGSPRVSGSTMASKAASRPGSVAVNGLRPPPRLAGAPGPSEPPRTPNPAGPLRPCPATPRQPGRPA